MNSTLKTNNVIFANKKSRKLKSKFKFERRLSQKIINLLLQKFHYKRFQCRYIKSTTRGRCTYFLICLFYVSFVNPLIISFESENVLWMKTWMKPIANFSTRLVLLNCFAKRTVESQTINKFTAFFVL